MPLRHTLQLCCLALALLMTSIAQAQRNGDLLGNSAFDRPLPWHSNVGEGVPEFWVRPGYKVTLVAENLRNARFMKFDDHGNLFLSRPDRGDILRLRRNGDKYDVIDTFLTRKGTVHGMDYADGYLWFTQSGSVHRVKDENGKPGPIEDILTGLPSGGHWWRSILVAKDGFFTSIGDESNISDLRDSDREKIWKYSLDGKTRKLWSSGIRNTEKLLYRPGTQDLYGCDQGSDWFGGPVGDKEGHQPVTNEYPPDEFNRYVEGGFYGHPFLVGDNVVRYEFMNHPDIQKLAETAIPPVWCFGPHWAADGWTFATKTTLGDDFPGDAIVGIHGSWNRTTRSGYRVERVCFDKATGIPYGSLTLVGTQGKDGRVLGRPVDVVEEPDGNLLFTDDATNRIYRISKG